MAALRADEAFAKLEDLKRTQLEHCTLQLWLPDDLTEDTVYVGGQDHGVALCDIVISAGGSQLLNTVADACRREAAFDNLSAIATGYWPILLVACRHHRLPVPPHFWITALCSSDVQRAGSEAALESVNIR